MSILSFPAFARVEPNPCERYAYDEEQFDWTGWTQKAMEAELRRLRAWFERRGDPDGFAGGRRTERTCQAEARNIDRYVSLKRAWRELRRD